MQPNKLINPIVAHRGAWLEYGLPENSLAAFCKAIEIGAGGTEFDVHMTADNVLVVNHDEVFFDLKIETSNYNDLLKYNLANGEKIPTVAEFLKVGLHQNKTKLIFEIKTSIISLDRTFAMVDQAVLLLENKDYSDKVGFIMFNWEAAKYLKSKLPNYNVAYLNGDKTPEEVKNAGLDGIDYNIKVFKKFPEYVSFCKKNSLILNSWTVDELEDLKLLLNYNFEKITTNKPMAFLQYYKNTKSNL